MHLFCFFNLVLLRFTNSFFIASEPSVDWKSTNLTAPAFEHVPANLFAWEGTHFAQLMVCFFKVAYTCFWLQGEEWIANYLNMLEHDTSYCRSLCYLFTHGLQLWNHPFWKGVGKKSVLDQLLILFVHVQAAGREVSPLTFVFPAELLNKMKWSKQDASTSSQSHYFASCMHRCCCCCIRRHWFTFITPPL